LGASGIRGLVVPLLTPLNEDFLIDDTALKNLSARLLNKGVENFFVLGAASEMRFFSPNEEKIAAGIVSDTIGKKGNLIVGCFGESIDDVVLKVKFAEKFSERCVVNVPPYASANDLAMMDFFEELFNRTSANIILYNNPFLFKRNIPTTGLAMVTDWERLVGFIDRSGDLNYLKNVRSTTNIDLFQADEQLFLDSMRTGCAGVMSSMANVFPKLFQEFLSSFNKLDAIHFSRLQVRINNIAKNYFPKEKNIQAAKYLLAKQNIMLPFHSIKLPILGEFEKQELDELAKEMKKDEFY
jgi:4-hydroxy-tetrahydrodipicolinate synthase